MDPKLLIPSKANDNSATSTPLPAPPSSVATPSDSDRAGYRKVIDDMASKDKAEYKKVIAESVVKDNHTPVPPADNKVYSITMVGYQASRTRIPAICKTFEVADELVRENALDLREQEYNLAVIEAVEFDVPYNVMIKAEQYWYRWNSKIEKYEPIEQPESYSMIVNWGIG